MASPVDGAQPNYTGQGPFFGAGIAVGSPTQVNMKARLSRRRANKIKQRLGGDLEKPKGMWVRSYERLLEKTLKAEIRYEKARMNHFRRLVGAT
jgi:hypothetical protein